MARGVADALGHILVKRVAGATPDDQSGLRTKSGRIRIDIGTRLDLYSDWVPP